MSEHDNLPASITTIQFTKAEISALRYVLWDIENQEPLKNYGVSVDEYLEGQRALLSALGKLRTE